MTTYTKYAKDKELDEYQRHELLMRIRSIWDSPQFDGKFLTAKEILKEILGDMDKYDCWHLYVLKRNPDYNSQSIATYIRNCNNEQPGNPAFIVKQGKPNQYKANK